MQLVQLLSKTVNSIGDNKAAIDKNTKAIEALNGKVGTTITNIESTINNKIEANNTTILNKQIKYRC